MATEFSELSAFMRYFVERYDGKLTGERLDRMETVMNSAVTEFQTIKQILGAINMALSDFSAVLSALRTDVAAIKAKSDAADTVKAENTTLRATIEDLKKQVADAIAKGGMTIDEENALLKEVSDLEAQLHEAPAPAPEVTPTPAV
jgi:chromosome segregation ATPase